MIQKLSIRYHALHEIDSKLQYDRGSSDPINVILEYVCYIYSNTICPNSLDVPTTPSLSSSSFVIMNFIFGVDLVENGLLSSTVQMVAM